VRKVSHSGESAEILFSCDPAKIKPGAQGNLILQAFGERPNNTNTKTNARGQRVPLGLVPAIQFEVIGTPAPGNAARWNRHKNAPVDYAALQGSTDETALKEVIACAGGTCELP
jgi:hypothetical protein